MKKSEAKFVTEYQQKLATITLIHDVLLDKLVEVDVLTKEDTEYILAHKQFGNEAQALRLYETLKTRANSFSKLKDVLLECRQSKPYELLSILDVIQTENTSVEDESSQEVVIVHRQRGNSNDSKDHSKSLLLFLLIIAVLSLILSRWGLTSPRQDNEKNPLDAEMRQELLDRVTERIESTLNKGFEEEMIALFSERYSDEVLKETMITEFSRFLSDHLMKTIRQEMSLAIIDEDSRKDSFLWQILGTIVFSILPFVVQATICVSLMILLIYGFTKWQEEKAFKKVKANGVKYAVRKNIT